VAKNFLPYYPLPNQAGDAQGRNNFLSENTRTDDFYALSARVDHQLSNNQRIACSRGSSRLMRRTVSIETPWPTNALAMVSAGSTARSSAVCRE
jgi:hypothetical protein